MDPTMTKLTHGHTERDWTTMAALDPELPARTQPREHSVRCSCGRATWNQGGACDAHYRLPGAVVALIGRRWPTLDEQAALTVIGEVTAGTMPRRLGVAVLDRMAAERSLVAS